MRRSLVVLALAAATATSGCSAAESLLDRVGTQEPPGTPTVSIGVLAPLSGGQTRTGTAVVDAVEQAVDDSGGVSGWDVEVVAADLAADDREATLDAFATDPSMIAVVTGFTADDIRVVVPELDEQRLTVLSPADTDPRHTRGADPAAPLRPWSGYVTVAVEQAPEQAALADHLVRVVGVDEALVVRDGSDGAAAAASGMQRALAERGVPDVEVRSWGGAGGAADVEEAVGALEPGSAVVLATAPDVAAALAPLRADGVTVALASQPPELDPTAADSLDGVVAPQPGADPRRGVSDVAAVLEASGRSTAVTSVSPAAYDGARLLVDALTRCVPDPSQAGNLSRSACRAEVAGAVWSGLTGPIQFDEYGARLGLLPSVLTLRDGFWVPPGG